jgi:integrase
LGGTTSRYILVDRSEPRYDPRRISLSGPQAQARDPLHLPGDFARAAEKAGLPPEFFPHSLRYCYASTTLAKGIPITEVSRWLGHKSIEVTHQIYGHLVPISWDRARAVLDDARRVGRRQPPSESPC